MGLVTACNLGAPGRFVGGPSGTKHAERTERVRRYRARAEELRTIARDWISDDAQGALFRVALDYDRMAKALEQADSALVAAAATDPH